MDKLTPRGLDATDLPDGEYRLQVAGGKAVAWVVAEVDGVQTVEAGPGIAVDSTDPENPIVSALFALTTTVGGAPEFVWDDNDELVLMEVVP